MVDYKITKKVKLLEVNNDMCHNYYYLVHGKIINGEKTRCRKFKFVVWHDIFDVQEFFDENEYITDDDLKQYRDEIVWATIEPYMNGIKDYNDEKGLKEFYDMCNSSIENYNMIRG